jgi:hypothetical protein
VESDEIRVSEIREPDLSRLASFTCSTGEPWEELVEHQIRGPLPRRYLLSPAPFDGRMLLATGSSDELLVVGAHHIEPTLTPNVGYTEVVAVALAARGTLVTLDGGAEVSLGAFMLLTIFRQMQRLGRHPRTFARIDRRNTRSLALCDRVGLRDEYPDPHDPTLLQRWGELPH